jgi:cellulose biosynthesis protein BcsQ
MDKESSRMTHTIAFWNNKGGTGKTSLAFQVICDFAHRNPGLKILAVDVCPQANLSELLLGGLEGGGSKSLLQIQGGPVRASVGGYFQMRLPRPYEAGNFQPSDFISHPHAFNSNVPANIDLLGGDPLLELQANAMATLANNQIPGTDTWAKIASWLIDFIAATDGEYDYVFVDTNPSFSIYTQVALAAVDRLVLPVMADDSSRRAIQNAFSLVYGLKLPSEIYAQHMFATRMTTGGLALPKVHLIVKNRITQYMGPASGYAAVLRAIDTDIKALIKENGELLTFGSVDEATEEIRDFQTTGVVAFARGMPFYTMTPGKLLVQGKRVAVDGAQIGSREDEIATLSERMKA